MIYSLNVSTGEIVAVNERRGFAIACALRDQCELFKERVDAEEHWLQLLEQRCAYLKAAHDEAVNKHKQAHTQFILHKHTQESSDDK